MKIYLLIATTVFILSSCNQEELASSNRENDSLVSILNERDSFINDFVASLNDIEHNLDSVSVRQHVINKNTENEGELKASQKSRINSEIASINKLMEENRNKIAELTKKLKKSSTNNVQLEKLVATLKDEITRKDAELLDLNLKLNTLNAQVAILEVSVDTLTNLTIAQSQTLTDKNTALHTAYFIVGKSNELKDAKIIDRKGGLLGIGKTSKLSDEFDNSKFTKIDYTLTNSIPVESDMKIITNHPVGSYTLQKNDKDKDFVNSIVITNSEMFWSVSKYLVVVKD